MNLGIVFFGATVAWFYFSDLFDKMGRSLGLIGLGVLFLAGGWALEKTRRGLLAHMVAIACGTRGGTMKIAKASIALLVLQLVIVSTVAAKYLYQRATCPRVWTRTAAYDPEMVMRGRYLSLQLTVDGCGSTLPSAKDAQFPRNVDGVPERNTLLDPFSQHRLVSGKDRRQR